MDFKKAFDTVPQNLLWEELTKVGVPALLIRAIQLLYLVCPIQICTANGYTSWITSTAGVRQGCPLSPTLFAIFMQDLQERLRACLKLSPVKLLHSTLCCLLFADDVVLLSTTLEGLQRLVKYLRDFCLEKHMEINLKKTAVVIFNRPRSQPLASGIWYQGQQIILSTQYKYLRMSLFSTKKIHEARLLRLQQATKASFHIQSRGLSRHIYHMQPLLKFLQACIIPVLTYAVEVWGPGCPVTGWEKLEPLQNRFLKRKLKVPDYTSTTLLLAETGLYPLEIVALKSTFAYYQQIHSMPDDRLPKQALLMNQRDAITSAATWVGQLQDWLARWQVPHHDVRILTSDTIERAYRQSTWGQPRSMLKPEQCRYLCLTRPNLFSDTWQMQPQL